MNEAGVGSVGRGSEACGRYESAEAGHVMIGTYAKRIRDAVLKSL